MIYKILFANILIVLSFVIYYSSNVMFMDDWGTPGNIIYSYLSNNLNLNDFWEQHNESRLVVFKIICVILIYFDIYEPIIFVVLKILLTFALVIVICKSYPNRKHRKYLFVILLTVALLPAQSYALLFGITWLNTLVPLIMAICIKIYFFEFKNKNIKYILLIALCIISTLTYANGMVLWFILNPLIFNLVLRDSEKVRVLGVVLFNIFAFIFISIYFSNYNHPSNHPSIIDGLKDLPRSLHFLAILTWSPFIISLKNFHVAPILLYVSLLYLLYISRNHFIDILKKRYITQFEAQSFAFIVYGFATLLVVSLGRSQFGLKTAIEMPHYPGISIFFHIGIFSLFFYFGNFFNSKLKSIFISFITLTIIINFQHTHNLFNSYANQFKTAKLALNYLELIPDNPFLLVCHHRPDLDILPKYKLFEANRIIESIDYSKFRFSDSNSSFGKFYYRNDDKTLYFSGFANCPLGNHIEHIILLVNENEINSAFCTLTFNLETNLKGVFSKKNSFSFDHFIDYSCNHTELFAYAVDTKANMLFPIEHIKN